MGTRKDSAAAKIKADVLEAEDARRAIQTDAQVASGFDLLHLGR